MHTLRALRGLILHVRSETPTSDANEHEIVSFNYNATTKLAQHGPDVQILFTWPTINPPAA